MKTEAVIIGLAISTVALIFNRRVSKNPGLLNHWNGWISATVLRFLGILAAAGYMLVTGKRNDSGYALSFMMVILVVVVSGMFLDLILSITRIRKINNRTDC